MEKRRVGQAGSNMGFGLGLRAEHYDDVLAGAAGAQWFEALTDNYLDTDGRPLWVLEQVRRDYPLALHGVAMSLGGSDPLDERYLERLKSLVDRVEPAIVSDHLCFSRVDGRNLFDLLPLPYTEEVLAHVVERVARVQDYLGRRVLIENASTYVEWRASDIPEAEFLAELARRADCGILLDVNNVYVSACNHGFDPREYLRTIPADRVGQIHLAGFTDMDGYLFDTHSRPVSDDVWDLYEYTLSMTASVPTMVEWDDDIPSWQGLVEELDKARAVAARRAANGGRGNAG